MLNRGLFSCLARTALYHRVPDFLVHDLNLSSTVRKAVLLAGVGLAFSVTSAFADTVFAVSTGIQPSNVGTITLHQVDADTVNVNVDLLNGYGFMNSGGKHTPFAFTLAGSETGVSAVFNTPSGGTYGAGQFSLNLAGGEDTPFGVYGVAIDSTAGNGSGNAYYGDLNFDLTRTSGLLESDFVATSASLWYYFAADLTDGQNTGSQAWKTPGTPNVPDSGMTAVLLGLGLVAVSFFARRRTA